MPTTGTGRAARKTPAGGIEAVVVLSGGQDSALCLALAARKYGPGHVAAITFRYGQRHGVETGYARALAKHFGIARHKTVAIPFYGGMTASALFGEKTVTAARPRKGASCPDTVVEGRNALFLLLAGIWAKSLGAKTVYTGVSQTDFSGYPDCRRGFIRAQERMMRLAMEWPFKIETPFMNRTKADEWALAERLGILELVKTGTVTCYNGIPGDGCGKCPACRLRAQGYREFEKRRQASRTAKASRSASISASVPTVMRRRSPVRAPGK